MVSALSGLEVRTSRGKTTRVALIAAVILMSCDAYEPQCVCVCVCVCVAVTAARGLDLTNVGSPLCAVFCFFTRGEKKINIKTGVAS